jgi:hypothetical protein
MAESSKIPYNHIKTVGASRIQTAENTLSSRDSYTCANAQITRGLTHQPASIWECYNRFPNVEAIGLALGVDPILDYLWYGPTGASADIENGVPYDLLTGVTMEECNQVLDILDDTWLGCLWGSPEAAFSCNCPDVGEKYGDYLRFRLNDATFWNTPIITPPVRREFLDSLKYGKKINFIIAGDFGVRPGDIVEVSANAISGYSTEISPAIISDKYYVASVKHTLTNSGVHETAISALKILESPDLTTVGK